VAAFVFWLVQLALAGAPAAAPSAFDAEYARLKQGRTYATAVPTGAMQKRHGAYPYWLVVPDGYDPAKRWQVRVQLHGGVMREGDSLRGDGSVRLAGDDQIYVMPSGWREAPWWSDRQVASLRAILEDVKRDYNVDENRVFLSGVSDGATGLYYVAAHDTTPYAALLPLNGFYFVLLNPELGLRGPIFLNNLRNKPFFVVNGGRDPLYPTSAVEPSLEQLRKGGVQMVYKPQPEAGHDTSWWPQVKDAFEDFVREHPRNPLPDRLTWETSDTRAWGRMHWLVLDSIGSRPNEPQEPADQVFRHRSRSGRIALERHGNAVEVTSRGVEEFTLLLSPAQFDLSQPVKVTTNGRVAFEQRVEKSVATLMKWAARDNDRTMLFGAEVKVRVR